MIKKSRTQNYFSKKTIKKERKKERKKRKRSTQSSLTLQISERQNIHVMLSYAIIASYNQKSVQNASWWKSAPKILDRTDFWKGKIKILEWNNRKKRKKRSTQTLLSLQISECTKYSRHVVLCKYAAINFWPTCFVVYDDCFGY